MKKYIYSERVNLFEPNVYIHFLVKITGAPTPEDLVLAVKTAFSMNEVTMSRIVLEKGGAAFYEKMNKRGCNVSIMQKDWMELIGENEKKPFEINKGEFIRCFVIPSDANLSLLIMAHHLVGDGKSIVYFIEDVMKALSVRN